MTRTEITQTEISKGFPILIVEQIICAIDSIMAKLEFVIGTERLDIICKRPQIFPFMISTYRHLRLATFNRLRRTVQHVEFRAFNVEFDVVDAWQIFPQNVSVEVDEFRRQRAVWVFTTAGTCPNIRRFIFLIAQAEIFNGKGIAPPPISFSARFRQFL